MIGRDALLTDLYQLTMLQGYYELNMAETAVFELFVRKLPKNRSFLVAAGLEQAVDFLTKLRFSTEELDWLAQTGFFKRDFLNSLKLFRFTGDVHAMPEGTVFFPNEPIIRVTAPIAEAQLVESRIINLINFQSLIASKAVRSVLTAPPETLLVDFGMRRAHGGEAGLLAARACYLAGFAGSATVAAGYCFGVPVYGTMAHSFIQAHSDESKAFENFAITNPDNVVLLIDTYDTEEGAREVVELAPKLGRSGIKIKGVRLDSGDLSALAKSVRKILDEGGLKQATIFASGNIDEYKLELLTASKAPIDGYGIGTHLDTSEDAPYLDSAYKLEEYAGIPKRKRSAGKATWPGVKQVFRRFDRNGLMCGDTISLADSPVEGQPLLELVMKNGRLVKKLPSLDEIRRYTAHQLRALPENLKTLKEASAYPVDISSALTDLAELVDKRELK